MPLTREENKGNHVPTALFSFTFIFLLWSVHLSRILSRKNGTLDQKMNRHDGSYEISGIKDLLNPLETGEKDS